MYVKLHMAKAYFDLSANEQLEVLKLASQSSEQKPSLLEKDIWVTWCLEVLFGSPIGAPLVFKGGTSLSKAYRVIRRFSEDVDLTYDIRKLAPDLVGEAPDALPPSRSQERKWSKGIRQRLSAWVSEEAYPFLSEAVAKVEPECKICVKDAAILIRYPSRVPFLDYIKTEIKLEFGARSTGRPCLLRDVECDIAQHVKDISFPTSTPRVMTVERTFWEKATAAHVYCKQESLRGKRYARHWYDITRLVASGHAEAALKDRLVAKAVADHKSLFFREKDASGKLINYHEAISGGLQLVPKGQARVALANDYDNMIHSGMLMDTAESFDSLMMVCNQLEEEERSMAAG